MTAKLRLARRQGLYVITDCEKLDYRTMLHCTEKILATGVLLLQYRDKSGDYARRYERAGTLKELCHRTDTIFLINDDIQLAADIGADGVHIGRDDPPLAAARQLLGIDAIIGVSCYNDYQRARDAQAAGADYIAFGAFYPTRTKGGTVKADPDLLRRARPGLSVPIAAIGGITPTNGGQLIEAGADLLAVVSSVYAADDPAQAVLEFNLLFQ